MTKIIIINLDPELSGLLGGVTHATLDVPDSFQLRLSKSVEALSVLNKITTESVMGFSVPYSPVNDLLFAQYANPAILDVKRQYFDCQVFIDSSSIPFTRLFVRGKNEKTKEWDLELARDKNHWVELSNNVKVSDIDFGSFQIIKSNIIADWNNPAYTGDYTNPESGNPVSWPLVDYGGWVDQTEPPQGSVFPAKAVGVEDFRPWFSLVYVLRAGFCKFGWSINSVLFEADAVKRLWIYALSQDYYRAVDSDISGRSIGAIYTRARYNNNDRFLLDYINVQADYAVIDSSHFPTKRYPGIKNASGISIKYRFFYKGEFHNDRSLPFTANFYVMEMEPSGDGTFEFTGELLGDVITVEFEANEKKSVTFEQVVVLKPGQMAAINIPERPTTTPGFYIEKGGYFRADHFNKSFVKNNIVRPQLCASPEYSILDALKGFVGLINGRIETDFDTRTVTIYPNERADVWGDIAPGFTLTEDSVIDIDGVVVADSQITQPVRTDLKQYTRFMFKSSTDAYVASQNLQEPPHSRTVLNGLLYPVGVEEIPNHLFEPTMEGQPSAIASGSGSRQPRPFLPRLWDNTSGERSFAIGTRILYAHGLVRQVNPNPINEVNALTSFFFDTLPNGENTGLRETFGYFTQSATWDVTPDPGTYVDLVFGTKAKDLFTSFYLGYSNDNTRGQMVDLIMKMKIADYQQYNFRRLFRFNFRGIPIIAPMVSIRDFADGLAPVQFFVKPASLECCELPCGCQFSECEYWQDFGVYMRSATLEDMAVESFEIDGIEYLDSPVYFNDINIVDISGRPYVTNLVDTLSKIGAPYFSFSYSNRIGTKGLRYFKIKHLLCSEFRIVISYNGSEMYEYTHNSQKQKWFTGSWADMGYGDDVTGVPENCKTTTEY